MAVAEALYQAFLIYKEPLQEETEQQTLEMVDMAEAEAVSCLPITPLEMPLAPPLVDQTEVNALAVALQIGAAMAVLARVFVLYVGIKEVYKL